MKLKKFLIKETSGWKSYEITGLIIALSIIVYNALFLHDSIIAICSSICGILYTIIAGKGKISCYFFGILGSGCYVYLAFANALWGNALLYLLYYIPMQVLGIFKWRKNLNLKTAEIIKNRMTAPERIQFFITGILGSLVMIFILILLGDKSPIIDGITTFLSILGMYCTVKRLIEQWQIWMIVNGLSFLMWLNLVIHGTRAYSTLVMWGVYVIFAIYFHYVWKKDLTKMVKLQDKL